MTSDGGLPRDMQENFPRWVHVHIEMRIAVMELQLAQFLRRHPSPLFLHLFWLSSPFLQVES